jgi:hypothetical protein
MNVGLEIGEFRGGFRVPREASTGTSWRRGGNGKAMICPRDSTDYRLAGDGQIMDANELITLTSQRTNKAWGTKRGRNLSGREAKGSRTRQLFHELKELRCDLLCTT